MILIKLISTQIAGEVQVVTVAQRAQDALATNIWLTLLYMLVVLAGVGALVAFLGMGLIYAERKIAARFQAGPRFCRRRSGRV